MVVEVEGKHQADGPPPATSTAVRSMIANPQPGACIRAPHWTPSRDCTGDRRGDCVLSNRSPPVTRMSPPQSLARDQYEVLDLLNSRQAQLGIMAAPT